MTTPKTEEVKEFYDAFITRSMKDYLYGNDRINKAVKLVLAHLPNRRCRALEIGCGMGVATKAIAKKRKNCSILATDISPQRIEYAKKLLPAPNIEYLCAEVSELVRSGNLGGLGGGIMI